ncbi:flagellin [Selenomonas sp. KH1T6]|nr:flagellin [Selenomonas ruminantium]
MAMTVINNPSAMMSLGELNKNVSKLGKQLAKVSSGQKVVGAGDGASEYAISEKMRVRTRALDRDEANVQTGISMLNVAAGGIQQQIEIMKNIKAKVIDADNDSNTDLDRITIQKEISQGFEHINDIAYETNYNGKLLLVGSKEIERVNSWEGFNQPNFVLGSGLELIEDEYDTLDGIEGPFGVLPAFESTDATAEPLLGSETSVNMTGGGAGYRDDPQTGSPATFTMDFSGYADAAAAEGVGFYTTKDGNENTKEYYVLTSDPGNKNYRHGDVKYENVTEIDISGCTTSEQIAERAAAAVKDWGGVGDTSVSGAVVTLTMKEPGTASNSATAGGWSQLGGTAEKSNGDGVAATSGRSGAFATGLIDPVSSPLRDQGVAPTSGRWVEAEKRRVIDPDTDMEIWETVTEGHYVGGSAGSYATIGLDIGTVSPGSGIRITGQEGTATAYVRFVAGSAGLTRDDTGVYYIGINGTADKEALYKWNNGANTNRTGVLFSLSNGHMILDASSKGTEIRVYDGFYDASVDGGIDDDLINKATGEIKATPAQAPTYTEVAFQPVKSYNGTVVQNNDGVDAGDYHDGARASYTIDLSAYDNTDADALESFIDELKGKILNASYYGSYEFIDKKEPRAFDAMKHASTYGTVDLNDLRTAVNGGASIADAFIGIMVGQNGRCFEDTGNKELKINAYLSEEAGNNETVSITEGIMSAYTIDFSEVGRSIPEDYYDKGFRVYCATCPNQWMNFIFMNGNDEEYANRPESGGSGADFKSALIDISNVTDVESLVEAIYAQGGDALEHMKNNHSHFLHFAADPQKGLLTVYDDRMFNLWERDKNYYKVQGFHLYPDLQEKGAKLADGIYDDVERLTRKVYVNDLIIHHTDKASMNIHLQIPQTSMDHIFGYNMRLKSYKDYDVLTVAHREELLGNQAGRMSRDGTRMVTKDEPGLLDKAIQYLADAATMVGAQTSRLETTHDNIIVQQESTAASESTIRDADMAKEFTEYTKSNILTQAAQSMLAQANQNSSSVLSLLQ